MTITSETTDFDIVRDVMKNTPLLSLKLRWSWKEFDWLYVFEFDSRFFDTSDVDAYMKRSYERDVAAIRFEMDEYNRLLGV